MIARYRRFALPLLGILLGLLATVALARGHRQVGYVRDEGIYFEASRRYARWVHAVVEDPGAAMKPRHRDRAFAFNREHPALMKTLAGLSAAHLAAPPTEDGRPPSDPARGGMAEGAAMRLPAQIIAGIGVALLFAFAGRRYGPTAGLLAAGWFILNPRVWFHAGLHAFDVPVAVAILATVLAYRAALRDPRWSLPAGLLLGVAIAIKHNALFVGPLVALHYYASLTWHRTAKGRPIARGQLVPLPLLSMAVLGPTLAWALWPWLWRNPIARLGEYFAFHRQHNWYNMEFLGHNFNQPPMPVAYPFVMIVATVSAVLLGLALIGLALTIRSDLRAATESTTDGRPRFIRPLPEGWTRHDGWLFAGFAAFPILLIALPTTPIFGGTKHWLTAYPFLALGAAAAWSSIWKRAALPGPVQRVVQPLALVIVLAPTTWATAAGHPFGLSQYAPLAGGPRGAARRGLNRGFWGHATVPLLPELRDAVQGRGPVYLHDLHELSRRQYEREGRWPPGLTPAGPSRARAGLLFHEKHMTADEVELWNALHTTRPHSVLTLHDVPLTSLYAEPK